MNLVLHFSNAKIIHVQEQKIALKAGGEMFKKKVTLEADFSGQIAHITCDVLRNDKFLAPYEKLQTGAVLSSGEINLRSKYEENYQTYFQNVNLWTYFFAPADMPLQTSTTQNSSAVPPNNNPLAAQQPEDEDLPF